MAALAVVARGSNRPSTESDADRGKRNGSRRFKFDPPWFTIVFQARSAQFAADFDQVMVDAETLEEAAKLVDGESLGDRGEIESQIAFVAEATLRDIKMETLPALDRLRHGGGRAACGVWTEAPLGNKVAEGGVVRAFRLTRDPQCAFEDLAEFRRDLSRLAGGNSLETTEVRGGEPVAHLLDY